MRDLGVGTNRYAYSANDPINKSDPNGHSVASVGCSLLEDTCDREDRQKERAITLIAHSSADYQAIDDLGLLKGDFFEYKSESGSSLLIIRLRQLAERNPSDISFPSYEAQGGIGLRNGEASPYRVGGGNARKKVGGRELVTPLAGRYLKGSGGRWGGTATRNLNYELGIMLRGRGFSLGSRPGGGFGPEEYIPAINSGVTGSTYVDITAISPNGTILRLQTINVTKDGSPTRNELSAAERMKFAFPNDALILMPKW